MARSARGRGGAAATAVTLLLMLLVANAPSSWAQVTFEASVPTTINGVQTQGIVVGCKSVDGQSVVDTDTISVALTSGVDMPVKVTCRSPVYMYDLLPAGSVPQRVIPIAIPLCDSPINPYTGEAKVTAPTTRRLARMIAAAMHMGHGKDRRLETTAFADWGVEEWAAYTDGSASLESLGLSGADANKLRMNITMVHYMYDMYQAAPGAIRMGMDALMGTDKAMFPPFMRNKDGTVMEDWMYKVHHGTEWAGGVAEPKKRKLLVGAIMAGVAIGMAASNTYTIDNNVLPRLSNIEDALAVQAEANMANARAFDAINAFGAATRDMLGDTASALDSAEQAISGLQSVTDLNAESIAANQRSMIQAAETTNAGFAAAYAEREKLRTEMLAVTTAAEALVTDMGETVNGLRDFTISSAETLTREMAKVDKRAADAVRKLTQDVAEGMAANQELALLVYQEANMQKTKRDLTGLFYAVKSALSGAGWEPFLWKDNGNPEDAMRTGAAPNPEDWNEASIARRILLDEIQVMFVERGAQGAGGAGTTNHVLHQHTFNIVCDAKQLMSNVAPWYTYKDIQKFIGPEECIPLAPGTVGGVPTTSPDPSRGEWTTIVGGDPKTTTSGATLTPCVCWIEFTAETCTHGETTSGTNPLDRAGFNPASEIGRDGLTSTALCSGTGASAPTADTTGYTAMAAAGINLFDIGDLLTSPTDPGKQWYHASQKYVQDWASFEALLEWECGHERFVPFPGNPTGSAYNRVKFFGDSSAYALVTSKRMSGLYVDTTNNNAPIPFVQKVKSYANSAECATQNTVGAMCYEQPSRANCAGCQACSADPISLSRIPEDGAPTPPANLAQAVFKVMDKAWSGLVYNLADMEVSLFGVMPADVALTTTEFTYSPVAKTSFKCRILTSVYTLGEAEPLTTQQLRSVHKYMDIRMDPWGNTGTQGDPDSWPTTTSGDPPLGGNVWKQATTDPSMFNDASMFLESNMVWAGSKACVVDECTTPNVFLASAGTLLPTEQSRYTYNVPQGLLSTSPDPAGRIGSPTYIMSPTSPNGLGLDGLTLNRWAADYPNDAFDATFASASLHHYYMPLVKDGNGIHCAASLTAAMGPLCGLLENYLIYTPTSDEYGDPTVKTECNKDSVICFRPKRWSYKQQFVVPQGTTTQSFVSACPTLDTSAILKGIPTVYLSHSTTATISARITMSGDKCVTAIVPVSVPPSKRVAVSAEVCGDMDIVVERFNAATKEWINCGNEEAVDVQPPPEFGGDAANITYVQPITYVQSIDNTRLIEVGKKQNKVIGDLRNLVVSMAKQVYGEGSDALNTIKANAPGVFNFTEFSGINSQLHDDQTEAAAAENNRVATAQDNIDGLKKSSADFDAKSKELSDHVNATIEDFRKKVDKVNEQVPRIDAAYDKLNTTTHAAAAANLKAAEALDKMYEQNLKLREIGGDLDFLKDAVDEFGDVADLVGDVVKDGLKAFSSLLEGLGDAFGGGITGLIMTLMMPCLLAVCVAVALAAGVWRCCGDDIKKGVSVAAENPELVGMALGAPLGPGGMAALSMAGQVVKAAKKSSAPPAYATPSAPPLPAYAKAASVGVELGGSGDDTGAHLQGAGTQVVVGMPLGAAHVLASRAVPGEDAEMAALETDQLLQ